MSVLRKIASKLLPHYGNSKLTSPPGPIPEREGKPILVKSKMRSGTHLLIDLILNNFPQLRTETLYVELDHAFLQGMDASKFENLGSCVCKTHFGNNDGEKLRKEITEEVRKKAYVIEPVRSLEEMKPSLQNFLSEEEVEGYIKSSEEFDEYWKPYESLAIPFKDLISDDGNEKTIRKIAEYIGEEPSKKRYYNRPKSEFKKVLREKLLTRLLGAKQRRINTTIQFNG